MRLLYFDMEDIVFHSFICNILETFCYMHIPHLLNIFKAKCSLVGKTALVIHEHERDPHRYPCLDICSSSANLRSVSHTNAMAAGPSLPAL